MIYQSNLRAPDRSPNFRFLHSRVQGQSMGHDVPSDWKDKADDDPFFGIYKKCGMWTHDEAAILYSVAQSSGRDTLDPVWLDIGAHTGWTASYLSAAGCHVIAVEPMLWNAEWYARFAGNLELELKRGYIMPWAGRSDQFFSILSGCPEPRFDGVVIDGDHDVPHPLRDAVHAHERLKPEGVILFHDFIGAWKPATAFLLNQGYKCKVYFTPHVIGCFWKGEWVPPKHTPDPAIDWNEIKTNHMKDFPWERCAC